jgi:LacI family transcriptional regulator
MKIVLALPWLASFGRQFTRGFAGYALGRPGWDLRLLNQQGFLWTGERLKTLRYLGADAVVTWTSSRAEAGLLGRWGRPVLDLGGSSGDSMDVHAVPGTRLPAVGVDDEAIGRCGAEFFLARDFAHFAYVGLRDRRWSDLRRSGFQAALDARGRTPTFLEWPLAGEAGKRSAEAVSEAARWLKALPKPAAILAANDELAREFCEVCREAGLKVPGEVAWLGVDNDEACCTFLAPALSSIDANWMLAGAQAGAALARQLDGDTTAAAGGLVPPVGVVERESTASSSARDPVVAEALRLIREHAERPCNAEDILQRLPISRRSVERRFRKAVGRSILEEIHRVKIEKAKTQLAHTDLQTTAIAKALGFSSADQLRKVFRKATGVLPTRYREQHRPAD